MARVTEEKIVLNVLKRLNEEGLPWNDSQFVIIDDEVKVLGDGGFAQVVLMEDSNNPEIQYAVKILGIKADKRIHQNDYENYKREAVLQYSLARECDTIVNILDKAIVSVKLNDSGEVEEVAADGSGADKFGWLAFVFIKMEKLEKIIVDTVTGDRLFCLPEIQNLDDKTALEFAIDIAEALYTSHKKNIMHRDVKLENVFFDPTTGKFKLGDFGIARITNHGSASTKGAGTLGYEAPEVTEDFGGKDRYTNKADIYSYGATLYVLLNNLRFPGSSTYNVERSVQYNPNAVIEKPEKGLPELQDLVCRCLQYYPDNRPESMEKVLYELYMILNKHYGDEEEQEENISTTVVPEKNDVSKETVNQEDKKLDVNIVQTTSDVLEKELDKQAEPIKAVEKEQVKSEKTEPKVSEKEKVEKKATNVEKPVKENKTQSKSAEKDTTIGSVVAEVEKSDEKDKKQGANDSTENKTVPVTNKPSNNIKLIAGFGLMLIGLALFELTTLKTEPVNYGMFTWILCAVSLGISGVSFIMKQKNSKGLPSFIFFLVACFAIYVLVTEGNIWPVVLLVVAFVIGGTGESLVTAIGVSIYPLLAMLKVSGLVNWMCNEKILFVFLFAILLGFFWLEQSDFSTSIISMLFSESAFMLLWGIILIVAGLVLGILKLLTVIDANSLIINMHLLYVGLALFVIGCIQVGKEGYGS